MKSHPLSEITVLVAILIGAMPATSAPLVTNVHGEQRLGTDLVDVYYDLAAADSSSASVRLQVSADGGTSWTVPVASVNQSVGNGVNPGKGKHILWNAGADWNGQVSRNVRFKVTASDVPPAIIMDDISCWNYMNSGDPYHHTEPVPGLFEPTETGILIRTNVSRGGGTMISKQSFTLAGKTIVYVWSGNGAGSFMDVVLGQVPVPWTDSQGYMETDCVNVSYGNSWAGSWLASTDTVYETTIIFTETAYTSVTRDAASGATRETRNNNFDFTRPLFILFRNGDAYQGKLAYLCLKSFKIFAGSDTGIGRQ